MAPELAIAVPGGRPAAFVGQVRRDVTVTARVLRQGKYLTRRSGLSARPGSR
ncbi:MAG: hypothetical protein U0R64_08900 [Candidatus Nanopelagicales bacterium]